MHKHDVRRQTDSRIEKVRIAYNLHGMPFPEQHIDWLRSHVDSYAYGKFITNVATKALHNYTKEQNMTPLQAATNKRDALIAERTLNRHTIAEFEQAGATLAERNAVLTTEILGLSATIGAEERKEREAKHKAMADELTAAGYKVVTPITGTMKYPSFQQIPKGFAAGAFICLGLPTSRGKSHFLDACLAAGGRAPGMNTPGTGAGSAQPASTTLGGVHGVGEGWYRPVVYVDQVMLTHDFAINTRDHHEARSQWWIKRVSTGHVVKGFPNEAEAVRWIKGYTSTPHSPGIMVSNWVEGQFHSIK